MHIINNYRPRPKGRGFSFWVSFYKEDRMKIDFMFMSKEACDSVYIALKTSNI